MFDSEPHLLEEINLLLNSFESSLTLSYAVGKAVGLQLVTVCVGFEF
jgi:hypothetical protein